MEKSETATWTVGLFDLWALRIRRMQVRMRSDRGPDTYGLGSGTVLEAEPRPLAQAGAKGPGCQGLFTTRVCLHWVGGGGARDPRYTTKRLSFKLN